MSNFASIRRSLMVAPLALAFSFLCTPAQAQVIEKDVLNAQGVRVAHIVADGVCGGQTFDVELERKGATWIMKHVKFNNACEGLGAGVSAAIKGMEIDEVISRFSPIVPCPGSASSCPEQLAKGLKKLKAKNPSKF